jgi:hypothetical protein
MRIWIQKDFERFQLENVVPLQCLSHQAVVACRGQVHLMKKPCLPPKLFLPRMESQRRGMGTLLAKVGSSFLAQDHGE